MSNMSKLHNKNYFNNGCKDNESFCYILDESEGHCFHSNIRDERSKNLVV